MIQFRHIVKICVNAKGENYFPRKRGLLGLKTAQMCDQVKKSHRKSPWFGNTRENPCSSLFVDWVISTYPEICDGYDDTELDEISI